MRKGQRRVIEERGLRVGRAAGVLILAGAVCALLGLPGAPASGAAWSRHILIQSGARTGNLGTGKFLVARRGLPSPVFAQSVIFLTHYDRKGAMGLIVNRPTDVPLSRALREIPGSQAREDFLYEGGPVENRGVLALLRSRASVEDAQHVVGDVYLIASKALLEKTLANRPLPSAFRVYLGYSGWGPGQLEREMEFGSWHVLDPGAEAAFDKDPETLWSRLIQLTELQIAQARHGGGSPAS